MSVGVVEARTLSAHPTGFQWKERNHSRSTAPNTTNTADNNRDMIATAALATVPRWPVCQCRRR